MKRQNFILFVAVIGFVAAPASVADATTRFVAPSGNDVGSCTYLPCATVTYAVDRAAIDDVIDVAAGTYNENGINVKKSLTIRGAAASKTIIQAATTPNTASDRVLSIDGQLNVKITNITIRHGKSSYGGGIYIGVGANVTMEDATVVDNVAAADAVTGYGLGGGIYIDKSATLTIDSSTISKNTAHSAGGGIVSWCFTTLTVTGSTISYNVAGTHGGGIDIGSPSDLIIDKSTISHNYLTRGGGGGGINNYSKATISRSIIAQNAASFGYGGGINSYGPMSIVASTISKNHAGRGGGIENDGALTIHGSTISDNIAAHSGGGGIEQAGASATITMHNSTVSGNTAAIGGAISVSNGSLAISNSTVAANETLAVHEDAAGIWTFGIAKFKSAIIANNFAGGVKPGKNCTGKGAITSVGVNLDTDGSCPGFVQVTSAELSLGSLQVNAPGSTATHALAMDSAAVNVASDCLDLDGKAVAVDQRGMPRPQPKGGMCDVGAYERGMFATSIAGDLDFDGKINVIDARLALEIREASATNLEVADINHDGVMNFVDAITIAKIGLGLITGPFKLSVGKSGSGGGLVKSTSLGIDCGKKCSVTFAGNSTVVLIGVPDKLSVISGWQGCDTSELDECMIKLNGERSVKVKFDMVVGPTPPGRQ